MGDVNNSDIILPKGSAIHAAFLDASCKRVVFFAGLSGVGKSLYIQQLAKMAAGKGRVVHLLQWDLTREAFQTPQIMQKYPEVNGLTHAAIRKAVGLWARKGITKWNEEYPAEEHILIGELPLVGNRLIEVVQSMDDAAEPLLASAATRFIVPVPSVELRNHIVSRRSNSISMPQHKREALDAPPAMVELNWQQVLQMAQSLQLCNVTSDAYDPEIYSRAYAHLLQKRHFECLQIDVALPVVGSVYELGVVQTELSATASEVADIFAQLERDFTPQQLKQAVDNWYRV